MAMRMKVVGVSDAWMVSVWALALRAKVMRVLTPDADAAAAGADDEVGWQEAQLLQQPAVAKLHPAC